MRKIFLTIFLGIILFAIPALADEATSQDEATTTETALSADEESLSTEERTDTQRIDELLNRPDKKRIAIITLAPKAFAENEKVRLKIEERGRELFKDVRATVIPLSESSPVLRAYLEDNEMIDGEEKLTRVLNRKDLANLCQELKADDALYIYITGSNPRVRTSILGSSIKAKVSCYTRLYNVAENQYIASKEVVKEDKVIAVLGVPDFLSVYLAALNKALDEIEIDASKL